MTFVATLVSNPERPLVDDALVEAAAKTIDATATKDLQPGIAVDLDFASLSLTDAESKLRTLVGDNPIDVFVQPKEGRRKKLLIADMDSTMIQQECIDELAAELGLKDRISDITERAMRGEIEFEPALKERVGLLANLPSEAIGRVLKERIHLTGGARALVQTMKANGAYCALVSGGFTHFTQAIAQTVGFDENRANTLIEENGKLTGAVGMPILGREAKRERLEQLIEERSIAFKDAIAIGDGANDLAMIERAGLGIAFHAKPAVASAADMQINHGDLTAVLYMQGYAQGDFKVD